jgi:AraC-like DNA-binding protein
VVVDALLITINRQRSAPTSEIVTTVRCPNPAAVDAEKALTEARLRTREARRRTARCFERAAEIHHRSEAVFTWAATSPLGEPQAHLDAATRHHATVINRFAEAHRHHFLGTTEDDNQEDHEQRLLPIREAPPALWRAIDYIEENAANNISINDIANAAAQTPRAIQIHFRRWLGCTPTDYLRKVRLRNIHRDLQTANDRADTVSAIAARWGWAHPGRFAVAYKAQFGSSPRFTRKAR